uniref:Uncharacterized protein n=1 Tax=Chromera velia CCMP2878 TaxID=1169474 RepID=A0A0G4HIX5_9ALVE|eukprot:Cvel_7006.t1-p1 / transcript=Cvel_7006.t1 / gene=Cvel_7006 / organism=Chromera_velia_CCMP2878 / gene_product=hypothetical protein / transcript_product=hypothetical protein / location=Cvel_scaffold356:72504-73733(+) / protein_length=69 / sequence_SO=supercontig / SO=protein_coding / is_pseudo=false
MFIRSRGLVIERIQEVLLLVHAPLHHSILGGRLMELSVLWLRPSNSEAELSSSVSSTNHAVPASVLHLS